MADVAVITMTGPWDKGCGTVGILRMKLDGELWDGRHGWPEFCLNMDLPVLYCYLRFDLSQNCYR